MQIRAVARRLRPPGDARLRRVLLAYGLGALIEFATWLTILLVAYARGGSVLIGVASFAMLLPAIVLVPVLAGYGDRRPRGQALAIAHLLVCLASALTGALLYAEAPFWVVLVGGAVLTTTVGLVRPMHFAALPGLATRPGDLVSANGLSSSLDGVAIFVGFVLAGVIIQATEPWIVFLGAVLIGGLATLLCGGLGARADTSADTRTDRSTGQIRAALQGFASLRGNSAVVILLAMLAITSIVEGSNETLNVTFNDKVLGLEESTAGLIAGNYGLGLALGGVIMAGLARRRTLAPLVLLGALVLGVAEASVSLLHTLPPAAVMLFLTGVGTSMIVVSARTLLQRGTDDTILARVMSIHEGAHLAGLTTGALIGPLLIAWLGPSLAYVPLGAGIALIGLLSHRSIRSLDARAPMHLREVELLSHVPFLAALPPYELERLAQGARWLEVPGGMAVVTQGEPGDGYYLVAHGELSVTVDEQVRDHTMSAGDGFGEISLLHRVSRTATITALTDCELLVVPPERFLAAVTLSVDARALAHESSQDRLAADDLLG